MKYLKKIIRNKVIKYLTIKLSKKVMILNLKLLKIFGKMGKKVK